jgi:hypothetical protein
VCLRLYVVVIAVSCVGRAATTQLPANTPHREVAPARVPEAATCFMLGSGLIIVYAAGRHIHSRQAKGPSPK